MALTGAQAVLGDARGRVHEFDLRRPGSAVSLAQHQAHADCVRRLAFAPDTGASATALASAGDDGAVQLCARSGKQARGWEPRTSVRPAGGAYAHGLAWGAAEGGVAPLFVGAWDGELACSLIDLAALGG